MTTEGFREKFERFKVTTTTGKKEVIIDCEACSTLSVAIITLGESIPTILDNCMTHLMECEGRNN